MPFLLKNQLINVCNLRNAAKHQNYYLKIGTGLFSLRTNQESQEREYLCLPTLSAFSASGTTTIAA